MLQTGKFVMNWAKIALRKRLNKKLSDQVKRYVHIGGISIEGAKEIQLEDLQKECNYMQFFGKWPIEEQNLFVKDMRMFPDFVTKDEEMKLFEEVEPYLLRLRYEGDHWDDAIHNYRETERKQWYPHNRIIIDRVQQTAFEGDIMPFVHVLDLAEDGVIKPHVDSTRYCGNIIAGVSLLTDCVMRLVRIDEKKYKQPPETDLANANNIEPDATRGMPKYKLDDTFYADILLKRRSLYIMSDSSRYNFTHEILSNDQALFQGIPISKGRRVSIICRNEVDYNKH